MHTEPFFSPEFALNEIVLVQYEGGHKQLTRIVGHRWNVVDSLGEVFCPDHRYYVLSDAWWTGIKKAWIIASGNDAIARLGECHSDERSRRMCHKQRIEMEKENSKARL